MITLRDLKEAVVLSTLYFFLLTLINGGEVDHTAPFFFFGGYLIGSAIVNFIMRSTGLGYETALLKPKAKVKKIFFIRIYRAETLKGKKLWIISNREITPKLDRLKRVTNHIFTRFI